jgi:hypothetical protein
MAVVVLPIRSGMAAFTLLISYTMKRNIRKIWCAVALMLATVGSAKTSWAQHPLVGLVPQGPVSGIRICPDGSIVTEAQACPTITFNLFGTLFNDGNGDGVRNVGEGGIASWNVSFFGVTESGVVIQEESLLSSASGDFSFQYFDAGNAAWYVEVAIPTGWEPTSTPFPGTSNIFRIETGPLPGGSTFSFEKAFGFRDLTPGGPVTPPVTVSEPTALALLGIGGMLMGVTRRRRRASVA